MSRRSTAGEPAPAGPSFEEVYGFGALLAAFGRARRAKRGRSDEATFYLRLEEELWRLSLELAERRYVPDPYRYFRVDHRKQRWVAEASFRDRVVHHGLVSALTPTFEPDLIPHTYACRVGLGTHRAVARAERLARRHRYFLKMDIAKFFETVPHDIVMGKMAARVDDPGVLRLCEVILAGGRRGAVSDGRWRGLPIGNLTSQFWGNTVLGEVDRAVFVAAGETTYTRYMDDMLVFGADKVTLWRVVELIDEVVRGLGLALKRSVTRVAPVHDGVPWLGRRIYPGTTRLDRPGRTRLARKLALSWRAVSRGNGEVERAEVPRAASVCGNAADAQTLGLRRSVLARLEREGDGR